MVHETLADCYERAGYADRPLSEKEIISMLNRHGNAYAYVNGVLFTGEVLEENTTGWHLFDLLAFLNY